MSLIQEALRRQQQEQERENPPATSSAQHPPLPEPYAPAENGSKKQQEQLRQRAGFLENAEGRQKKSSSSKPAVGLVLTLSILLLCIAVGAVVFLANTAITSVKLPFKFGKTEAYPPIPKKAPEAAAPKAQAQEAQSKVTAHDVAAKPDSPAAAHEPDKPEQRPAADVSEKTMIGAKPVEPAINDKPVISTQEGRPPKPAQVASAVEGKQLAKPAQAKEPVSWPAIKLNAVVRNPHTGQSAAMLNNKVVDVGDEIEGVKLLEVLPDAVRLRCGQEIRLLRLGQTF